MPAKRAAKQPQSANAPNQYHLSGGGISVVYYPNGMGPVMKGGPICLAYQDTRLTKGFVRNEVRTAASPDLGTLVSVTLNETVDLGSTTFTIVIPNVRLPDGIGSSASIATQALTTFHRTFLAGPGQGQQETYTASELTGDARIGLLAM
jgi:hypothetical protein